MNLSIYEDREKKGNESIETIEIDLTEREDEIWFSTTKLESILYENYWK